MFGLGAGRCLRVNFVPIGPKCFEFVLVSLKNLTRLRAKELISLSKYTRIDLCKLNTFNFFRPVLTGFVPQC